MSADRCCGRIADAQFGVLSRLQALKCGVTPHGIKHRIQAARWQVKLPTVYRVTGAPGSWEQDATAACLWAGEGSAISHRAAARLWGLAGFGLADIEISTVLPKRNVTLGFPVHRVRKELLKDIDRIEGIPVTSARWTLLDLAGTKHPRAERALDQVLARELATLGQMWRLYEEQWTRGRRGIAILRSYLSVRTPGNAPDDSELERVFDEIIRDFSLPEPARQKWIHLPNQRIRVDYCYPGSRLIIEVDSYAYHSDRETFTSDRVRDNELQASGWRVLRFTWAQLRFEPAAVAEMIRRHLELRPLEW